MAVVSPVISLILLAVVPPTDPTQASGWTVAGVAVAATLGGGLAALRTGSQLGWDGLAVVHWVGLAALGVLVWVTGGTASPQTSLLLLWIVLFAACHPPRRAVGYLVVAGLVTVAPLVYDSGSATSAGEVAAQLVTWFFMAGVANAWVVSIRKDRLDRIHSEEAATTLACIDPLTGLGNRRSFDEALISLTSRAHEAPPLSLVVADIDQFKDINDHFGHVNGDECLRQVSSTLREVMRGHDLIYRREATSSPCCSPTQTVQPPTWSAIGWSMRSRGVVELPTGRHSGSPAGAPNSNGT